MEKAIISSTYLLAPTDTLQTAGRDQLPCKPPEQRCGPWAAVATFPPLKGLHPGALTNSYCPGTISGETSQRSCTDHEQICANEAGFWLLVFCCFFFFSEKWVKRDSMGASATGCEWVTAGRWEVKPHPAAVTSTPTCSFRGRKSCSGDTHLLSLPGEFSPLHHSQDPLHPATPCNPRGHCPPAAPISAVKLRREGITQPGSLLQSLNNHGTNKTGIC